MNILLEEIAAAGETKQAEDIIILNVRKASRCIDYMVIMSAESRPQLKAITREIDQRIKEKIRWEGEIESGWVILDLGPTVVHVMDPELRAYYDLENLWGSEAVVYHI